MLVSVHIYKLQKSENSNLTLLHVYSTFTSLKSEHLLRYHQKWNKPMLVLRYIHLLLFRINFNKKSSTVCLYNKLLFWMSLDLFYWNYDNCKIIFFISSDLFFYHLIIKVVDRKNIEKLRKIEKHRKIEKQKNRKNVEK